MIRPACASDADTIARIYNHYVANTIVTFEEEAVSPGQISDRLNETRLEGLPWLVAEDDGAVMGYAYASKWKGRCAYRHSVEVTVYLSHLATSRGWGSSLYTALFSELEALGVHVAIGGIALPNEASIALHEKFGMGKVAHFQEIGFKFGQWVDVGYWQKKLPT